MFMIASRFVDVEDACANGSHLPHGPPLRSCAIAALSAKNGLNHAVQCITEWIKDVLRVVQVPLCRSQTHPK